MSGFLGPSGLRPKTRSLSQPRWTHSPRGPGPAQPQGPPSVLRAQKPYLYKTHPLSSNIHTRYFRGGRGSSAEGWHGEAAPSPDSITGGDGGGTCGWRWAAVGMGREEEAVPVAGWRTQRWGRSLADFPAQTAEAPPCVSVCAEGPPQVQDGDPCPSPGREAGQFVKKETRETVYQPASWLINNGRSLHKIIQLFQWNIYDPAFVCFCFSNRKNKDIFGYLRKWEGLTGSFFSLEILYFLNVKKILWSKKKRL